MASDDMDISARVNAAVTRELARRLTAELQESAYENVGQGGSRGHSVDWFDAADAGGFDWSIVAFGHKLNPLGDNTAEVRIYPGEINRIASTQTDLTLANADFVYVRRTVADGTLVVLNGASVPADTVTYRYYKLYQFAVADGVAKLTKAWRVFNIEDWMPTPASTGTFVLVATDGVLSWVELAEFACS